MTSEEMAKQLRRSCNIEERFGAVDAARMFDAAANHVEQQAATIARLSEEKSFLEGEISTLNDRVQDLERLNG